MAIKVARPITISQPFTFHPDRNPGHCSKSCGNNNLLGLPKEIMESAKDVIVTTRKNNEGSLEDRISEIEKILNEILEKM